VYVPLDSLIVPTTLTPVPDLEIDDLVLFGSEILFPVADRSAPGSS
jgi:hypothetical protein